MWLNVDGKLLFSPADVDGKLTLHCDGRDFFPPWSCHLTGDRQYNILLNRSADQSFAVHLKISSIILPGAAVPIRFR